MTRYRDALPQLGERLFLTDGGIETTLIFHEGLALPDFAAFDLLKTPEGEAALRKYFRTYADVSKRFGTGVILESATWRASADWGERLGYSADALAAANRHAIRLLEEIRRSYDSPRTPVVISGCVGPRGDGYVAGKTMSAGEAQAYHAGQVRVFAGSGADMVSAITMNYVEEAVGVARAAKSAAMPVAIAFTVETDGRLPTGQPLLAAIEEVDAATDRYPAYFMVNCAHPTHFDHVLLKGGPGVERIRGLRANASRMSHAELNEATELDSGNPAEFGAQHADLRRRLPHITIMGGCCGTDHRHVEAIARACLG